jgi:uncharacterized repeat protein (TIGR03803 family)
VRTLAQSAFTISLAAALLGGGCGGSQSPISAPGVTPQTSAISARTAAQSPSGSYQQLYRFQPRSDGIRPAAGLLNVHGTLYGTTPAGGLSHMGAIYSISSSGVEKLLYRFRGGADGSDPQSGLIDVKGRLYGTTEYGGSSNAGTVYSVSLSGREKVLYAFKGNSDGANPRAGLTDVNGLMYGTTFDSGGSGCFQGCGTVFSITTSGQESVLHSFTGGFSDGGRPRGELIDDEGVLYGTTESGGSAVLGTVFSISPAGVEKVLYSFQGRYSGKYVDGNGPLSGLIRLNDMLYGTTYGGGYGTCPDGCGTVYRVSTAGAEKLIYSFGDGSDGAYPVASLVGVHDVLYGTTLGGGGGSSCFLYGTCGTVYSVTTRGVESVLYRFAGHTDGSSPVAPLTNANGNLYGATQYGGDRDIRGHYGFRTVFALTL